MPTLYKILDFEVFELEGGTNIEMKEPMEEKATPKVMTIDEATKSYLQFGFFFSFFQKKPQSNRRCKTVWPPKYDSVCKAVFRIIREVLRDEKYLGCFIRAGLGQPKENAVNNNSNSKRKNNKGGKTIKSST